MCGIVGYIGSRNSVDVVIQGLRDLDYRGYEAAGIAVLTQGSCHIEKRVQEGEGSSRVDPGVLLARWQDQCRMNGDVCIGHTRWPTHGANTVSNAHPHTGMRERVVVVHNGVISNFYTLRKELLSAGVTLRSDTDTEIVAHMIERELDSCDVGEAVRRVVARLDGSYAFLVCDREMPGVIVAAVLGSPMLVGLGDGEVIIASDEAAVARVASRVIDVEDGEVLVIRRSGIEDSAHVERAVMVDPHEIDTQGYAHHMIKEIMEQPRTVRAAMSYGGRLDMARGMPRFGGFRHFEDHLSRVEHVVLVACGTAYHAALIGARYLREIAGIPYVEAMIASEADVRHLRPENSMVIAISQSGETYDTKRVVEEANLKGIFTFGVVNRPGSWIARATKCGVYCQAGAEIAVASTKVFVSQVSVLYMISVFMGRQRRVQMHEGKRMLESLESLSGELERMLVTYLPEASGWEATRALAEASFVSFIGKGYFHPIALEGALKFQEITYTPAQGFPSGELKHGPLALLDEHRPTVVLVADDEHAESVITGMMEAARTGSYIIAVVAGSVEEKVRMVLSSVRHSIISVPHVDAYMQPIVHTVVLQLLAYFTGLALSREIDKPRNLAKSVTVA